jgi:hypothetical protein
MTTTPKETWLPCAKPAAGDTIRWREPIWDKPNKPRGKPDQIGEQAVTAKVITLGDPAELLVIGVKRLSLNAGAQDAPSKIKPDDMIRRKLSSIQSGDCQKLSRKA